jgi:hypothetical protein
MKYYCWPRGARRVWVCYFRDEKTDRCLKIGGNCVIVEVKR